jgi:hypothetical protein
MVLSIAHGLRNKDGLMDDWTMMDCSQIAKQWEDDDSCVLTASRERWTTVHRPRDSEDGRLEGRTTPIHRPQNRMTGLKARIEPRHSG